MDDDLQDEMDRGISMIVDPLFRRRRKESDASEPLIARLGRSATPLATPADLDPLLDAIGDARFVLLGEATHGTSEFYTWRAEISRRLIREKGFSFIAVEGDWPDCYRVNRYAKWMTDAGTSADEVLHAFERWPTWMWANREVVDFVEWLRDHNHRLPPEQQVGFYGLDVYSLWESMAAVVEYLERVDPPAARVARRAYACFDPYYEDAQEYARATALVPTSCEDETLSMLRELRAHAPEYPGDGRDSFFNAEQNALIAQNAERYYRTMIRGGATSWNVRDHHMVETLDRLAVHHGPLSKAIVWEHNTHIGDARFTDMARHGMVNVGQLVRQAHGELPSVRDGVALVGFGTHRGTVMAASEWGAPMQRMQMAIARAGSWEDLVHQAVGGDGLFVFDGSENGGIPDLDQHADHRAIGVVYNPGAERWGNYVPTVIPSRYDAFLFVDETRAVDALHMLVKDDAEVPETYPSGM
jgi:erythromycin esterase